jgi:hypothetical protein
MNRCERCSYDEADPEVSIPDIWADWYQTICAHCADEGHRRQAKMEGGKEE